MNRPELPHPYVWKESSTINAIREDGEQENVAWYYLKEYEPEVKYHCVSAPVGLTEGFYRADVDTEDEAVALIISFALLGITKE